MQREPVATKRIVLPFEIAGGPTGLGAMLNLAYALRINYRTLIAAREMTPSEYRPGKTTPTGGTPQAACQYQKDCGANRERPTRCRNAEPKLRQRQMQQNLQEKSENNS